MLFNLENKDQIREVKVSKLANHGFSEKDLENIISNNIEKLIPENQLMAIFQERVRQSEADIYALNEKGDLFIFELKRGKSKPEDILQVLRYGQRYGQYSYEQLNELLKKYKKDYNIDLAEKHQDYFQETLKKELEHDCFNNNQHLVVIANGIDKNTFKAIRYWKEKGLNIDSIPYNVYTIDDKPFLEISTSNPDNEEFIEYQEGYYIVNTNKTWMKDAYKDMLDHPKAAAYWVMKGRVAKITKGDTVYLYHNGVGIIAKGKATGGYESKELEGHPNEEFFVPLELEWKVDIDSEQNLAIAAWEIKKKTGLSHSFRQTVFSITKEMISAIDELRKEKCNK